MNYKIKYVISIVLLLIIFINSSISTLAPFTSTVNYSSKPEYKDYEEDSIHRKSKEYSELSRDEDSITPIEQFFQILKMDTYLLKACIVKPEAIGFYLYTKDNAEFDSYKLKPHDLIKLQKSQFSSNKKTIFFIHSALQEHNEIYVSIKNAYFQKQDVNFIAVTWDHYSAFCEYLYTSAYVVPAVGNIVTDLINLLSAYGTQLKDIHIIGHGLGAHIAGHVGRKLDNKLGRITGLDPARCGFEGFIHLPALGKDAEFVDVIHTNAQLFGYGIWEPVGHIDFFPNGGGRQPGCPLLNCRLCNHGKSVEFFAKSIISNDGFYALHCDTWDDFENNSCNSTEMVLMGEYAPKTARGKFYLRINEKTVAFGGKQAVMDVAQNFM